jgi:peptide/nickel transport system permease protein
MNALRKNIKELLKYPSAVAGTIIILILVGISIYTVIAIPYSKAIMLWRGGEDIWYKNPKLVPPEWTNFFHSKKEPVSFVLNATNAPDSKVVETGKDGDTITITYTFDYQYDDFPQEMMVYFKTTFQGKQPFVSLKWTTPDGREIQMGNFAIDESYSYRFSQDQRLTRLMFGVSPEKALMKDPTATDLIPLKGTYKLTITAFTFESGSTVDAEFVLHGKVYGLAGTDYQRRDIMIALLWGTPIALSFGLLAALGTTLSTMIIAAFGVWYGGWVDGIIQRITGVNMVLPFLPILIMIGTFYSRSIWMILGATILLSIFGAGILSYRAMFLQIKEAPFIEAAKAYGASDARIIFRYLTPRIIPVIVPALVSGIPGYVFLEASLAYLGLGDPVLPTWGKLINDAQSNGALYAGLYYWVLEPAVLLMITGIAFALLGFTLDRIFNPRLRGM